MTSRTMTANSDSLPDASRSGMMQQDVTSLGHASSSLDARTAHLFG
jgi:hypothetical protein